MNTLKVVMPKDLQPNVILGVITANMNEAEYLALLENYYGFPCAVFEKKANATSQDSLIGKATVL